MQNKNMPTSNILKDDFGWEVPFETVPLPSRGVVYHPDSKLYNKESISIKAMTALEEDILSSQAFIKEGTSVARAIQSCIVEDNVDVDEMISGDKNALMISMRITGYGSRYPVLHSCANCGAQNEVDVQLNELAINRLKEEPIVKGENKFKFLLPVSGKEVIFKFLTGYDEKEEKIKKQRMKSMGINLDNNVTSFLEQSILSIDNITDKNKISHFIKHMPAMDSRKLRLHIINQEPGIDMTWKYVCNSCTHNNELGIPISTEFFWPST